MNWQKSSNCPKWFTRNLYVLEYPFGKMKWIRKGQLKNHGLPKIQFQKWLLVWPSKEKRLTFIPVDCWFTNPNFRLSRLAETKWVMKKKKMKSKTYLCSPMFGHPNTKAIHQFITIQERRKSKAIVTKKLTNWLPK